MEEEEEDDEVDWESFDSNYYQSSSLSSSSHNLSPLRITPHRHNDLSIFPPINHEGLAIPPPPRARVSLFSSDSDSQPSSPSQKPPDSNIHLPKWVDFAFHLWNSKLLSFLARIRSLGFFSSLRLVVSVVPFVVVLWFWLRRRRRRCDGQESVEQLKLIVKEKDEKIIQLLEQIAQMNKLLLARYRIPVIKSS